MKQTLYLHNTLSSQKEEFIAHHAPHVGMYVCGPTVYGDAHLGHARPAITFDLLFRYLQHIGYKVRYVRNITDVGHLENDADEGEDKVSKKALLEQLEPMEIVQRYTYKYHADMERLNVLPPSIEPRASGHIIEQIETIKTILDHGYAYQSNGSVYFDVEKYNKDFSYGILSHRQIEDMLNTTRQLDGQEEKRNKIDFALWKKASSTHIMRWPSPWSDGYPGWHIECSAMGMKYLGTHIDIHGGGMDLVFPHHEAEIAQNTACLKQQVVKYWIHNNMITINGQKMGKSLGNFITLEQFFEGTHPLLNQAYSPMTIRFFILQAHYRSTLDFSNEALQAAEKAFDRLCKAYNRLSHVIAQNQPNSTEIEKIRDNCYKALNDDLNSAVVIANICEAATMINRADDGKITLSEQDISLLKQIFDTFLFDILGMKNEMANVSGNEKAYAKAVELLLDIRAKAREQKDWATCDRIRDELLSYGFEIKDGKNGVEWSIKKK